MSNGSNLPALLRLLLDLANPANAALLQQFHADPEAVMNQYGLTPGEQTLLLSGDLKAIREAIDATFAASDAEPPSDEETYPIVVTWAPRPKKTRRGIGVWGG